LAALLPSSNKPAKAPTALPAAAANSNCALNLACSVALVVSTSLFLIAIFCSSICFSISTVD
jgi:hypothetical protein